MTLRSFFSVRHLPTVVLAIGLFSGAVLTAQSAEAPTFSTDITLAQIMESIVMPTADVLWKAVSVDVTEKGSTAITPQTDEEWIALRHQAITLASATNLLLVPGLQIDTPANKTKAGDGELTPAAIAKLRNENMKAWVAHAQVLHEIAMQAVAAINKHDADGLSEVGGSLDEACESCHLQFWYPNQQRQ